MSDLILEAKDIRAGYGALEVLKGISISLSSRETVSIIGANGAGKTTLMGVLSGTLPVRSGTLFLSGEEITKVPAHERVSLGLALVPEGRKIFPRLTVEENLELGAYTKNDKQRKEKNFARAYELFPILWERKKQQGGTLSGGEQQMLALARALMSEPEVLLLDEPSMGVAPLIVEKIFETISALSASGMSILLVEQNAELALRSSSRAYVLEVGSVTLSGQSDELLRDERVRAAYLGA